VKVKAIKLENFMAFEDTGWIEFKPINVEFKRNWWDSADRRK